MYHMLPFAYRPQANYTRNQHGEFQNLVEQYVTRVLRETDIVDADNKNGRSLFNSIDTFFSYGLLTKDGAYWRCIRNFLPRAEQKMLIAECGDANDRFLSIGWLKTSFNKGTLHFMLVSLNNHCNKTYLTNYYHANACVQNNGLLEAITHLIEKLHPVQFAFYSTRQLRAEPVMAAVIETAQVQISSRDAARQRKLTEKEASQDTVPNIIPTEIPSMMSQTVDQHVSLDELVRNSHNRWNIALYDNQHVEDDRAPSPPPVAVETLEDVMTKKMSCVNIKALDSNDIDHILASVEQDEPITADYNLADGEYQMSQGNVLHLAINVFEKSSEKIIECFKVIESFHSDSMKLRYFVMTNYNIYVFKYSAHTQNLSPGKTTSLSSEGSFIPLYRMPHDRIRTIKISVDNLSFMLESNEAGFFHYIDNEVKDDNSVTSYSAAMAGLESGAHMINSLINLVEHSSREITNQTEVDDHIGYMCMLQPSLEKQLGRSIDVRAASLCFWYEQPYQDRDRSNASKSGYLYKTNVGNWIKSSMEAEQKYFIIVGNNMHAFADSTCKVEDMVINLKGATVTITGRVTFQLKGNDGTLEFECPTQEDHAEWTRILLLIAENKVTSPYMSPCLAVVTENSIALVQEGEKFWSDGFLRLINELFGKNVKQSVVANPPDDKDNFFSTRSPALCLVTIDDTIHYFFVRFEKELERLASAVESTYGIHWDILDKELLMTPVGKTIHNACCAAKDLWPV